VWGAKAIGSIVAGSILAGAVDASIRGVSAPYAVIGGGVIGLCTAHYLRRAGHDVVVLERATVGAGSSSGNAGWIVPSLSAPVPGPGQLGFALRSLINPDSPLYVRAASVPGMLGWLLGFARRCNRRDNLAGLHATAALAAPTMQLYDELAANGVAFEMRTDGILFAHLTVEGAREEINALGPLAEHGYCVPAQPIVGADLHTLEPALTEQVRAGVMVEGERHVAPMSLVRGLTERLVADGVEVREGASVEGFERAGERVTGVVVDGCALPVSGVLLAAGAWTGQVAARLGCRLPVQAGKGYSFSLAVPTLPCRPLYLADARVGCTPIGNRLRVAGTMELSGINTRLDDRRIEAIVRTARGFIEGGDWDGITERWVGMRPMAPDGLPIIGRLEPYANAYVATGHAMLGVTLAPATGRAVAAVMSGGPNPPALQPFRPGRF
jgi:D-amino-acid dehydrogenase